MTFLTQKPHFFTVNKPENSKEGGAHGYFALAIQPDIAYISERIEGIINSIGINEFEDDEVLELTNDSSPRYYSDMEGEFNFNFPALQKLHERGYAVPNIEKFYHEEYSKKDFDIGNLEYNINAGNITLSNKKRSVFFNQNSPYAFCLITHEGEAVSNIIKSLGLNGKDHSLKGKQYNDKDHLYIAPSGIKKLIDAQFDFDNLPGFENKEELFKGIIDRAKNTTNQRWIKEILNRTKPTREDLSKYKNNKGDPSSLGM
jgi:hypothetical protein